MKWIAKTLSEIADFELGKMLDEKKNRGELLPYLANINVRWGEFGLTELREMKFSFNEIDRYGLKHGDIVMCEGGEPGRCAIWKGAVPQMMFQKALHRIRARKGMDYRFLYYTFLFLGRRSGFTPLLTGATIKHLPKEKLAKLEISFPARLQDQIRIANILTDYDNLIDNNRKRIALLEESTRELYKEWFVRLRFPGYEHTKIVKGVPERWEKKKLRDVLELKYGKSLKASDRSEGQYPVYGSSGQIGTHASFLVEGPGIVVGRKGNAGTVFWVNSSFFPIDTVYYLNSSQVDYFIYHNLCNQNFQSSHGAVPGLSRDYAYSLPIVVPDVRIKKEFLDVVTPIHTQCEKLQVMNNRLGEARDILLPKLMNGEIEV